MKADAVHSVVGSAALVLIAGGAWQAWGCGYAALILGSLLLAAIVYARTR